MEELLINLSKEYPDETWEQIVQRAKDIWEDDGDCWIVCD